MQAQSVMIKMMQENASIMSKSPNEEYGRKLKIQTLLKILSASVTDAQHCSFSLKNFKTVRKDQKYDIAVTVFDTFSR